MNTLYLNKKLADHSDQLPNRILEHMLENIWDDQEYDWVDLILESEGEIDGLDFNYDKYDYISNWINEINGGEFFLVLNNAIFFDTRGAWRFLTDELGIEVTK